jgi:hypothetical protein
VLRGKFTARNVYINKEYLKLVSTTFYLKTLEKEEKTKPTAHGKT